VSEIIIYFGPGELLLAASGLVATAVLGTLAWHAWRDVRQRRRLLDGLPYPALLFRGERLQAHNAPALDWRDNLDVRALARDAGQRRQDILRTIPAVEGQSFQARAIALPRGETLVLLEDMAAAQRQQAFYRNFIQNVSHELKTPLTIIQGHAAKMGDEPDDRESWLASRRIIADEAKRLTQLVDNLLTLARLESPSFSLERAPLSVTALLEEAVLQVSDLAEARRLSLSLHLTPGLPRVSADRARLKQVVLNLLDNALKYTPPSGAITVSAAVERNGAAGQLVCCVQDTGEGIPPDDLPYIFDKLYRARRARGRPVEGSGLGLTIAREIIRAHGGEVHAESEPGRGSTFTFTLPCPP
jgi:two-component system phosphate regulon sensor histidine kinase PhoR